MNENDCKKCSIVVFSGEMDKVMGAFIIATTTAAMGMETSIFFTFWGLQAIKKERTLTGRSLFGRMLGFMFKDIKVIGPSKMNFGGIGRWMFKKMMKDKNVASLSELRQTAIDLGVKLLGCQMSMRRKSDSIEKHLVPSIEGQDDDSGCKGIDLCVVLCYTNHASRPPRTKITGLFRINCVGLRMDRPAKVCKIMIMVPKARLPSRCSGLFVPTV